MEWNDDIQLDNYNDEISKLVTEYLETLNFEMECQEHYETYCTRKEKMENDINYEKFHEFIMKNISFNVPNSYESISQITINTKG